MISREWRFRPSIGRFSLDIEVYVARRPDTGFGHRSWNLNTRFHLVEERPVKVRRADHVHVPYCNFYTDPDEFQS